MAPIQHGGLFTLFATLGVR